MNGGGAVGGGDTRGDTDTDTDNDKNVVIFLGPETEQTGRWAQDTIRTSLGAIYLRALMHIEIEDTNHFCNFIFQFFAKVLQKYFFAFLFLGKYVYLSCVSVI